MTTDQMRLRIGEETERFLRYGRPMALMVIHARPSSPAVERALLDAVAVAVRVVDVVAWDGREEAWVMFPETSDSALIPAQRVMSVVTEVIADATAALARCPEDGIDAEGLIGAAKYGAQRADPGMVVLVGNQSLCVHVGSQEVVAADPLMRGLFSLVERIASSEIPVLIMGETGAGKEIVAQAVHAWSKRRERRMFSINCAAFAETLLESELFGHERGAFTGATASKAGLFEQASGGTIFLDEIGECSPRTQAELLRVLESKKFCRIGSLKERDMDARIVAATNRSLEDEIRAGRFRQDLYFRLNTATVHVPPLRDRPTDIPVLARHFLGHACEREKRELMRLSEAALQRIALHDWPGNVREMRNTMDFVAATVQESVVEAGHLPPAVGAKAAPWMLPHATKDRTSESGLRMTERQPPVTSETDLSSQSNGENRRVQFRNLYDEIRELEKTRIQEALEAADGVRNRAAALIGIPLRTLVTKIRAYGLAPAPKRRRKPVGT